MMFLRSRFFFRDHRTVVSIFKQVGELQELLGEKYRAKAYAQAVRSLEAFEILKLSENVVPPYKCGNDVAGLPGIGDKLVKKIDEILTTGSLSELTEMQKQPGPAAVRELTRVHGIGPVNAMSLFLRYGISNVDALRKQHEASLNGPKQLLTPAQFAGLQYLDDIEKRIPREEVMQHEKLIRSIVSDVTGGEAVVCGSFRRGLATVGDVDVLVPSDLVGKSDTASVKKWKSQLETLLERFQTENSGHVYHLATLAQGPTKWMTVSRLNPALPARRVDLRFVPTSHFAAALMYFTGSKQFNIDMRARAAAKGYLLNEYGLFRLHRLATLESNENVSAGKKKVSKKTLGKQLQTFSLENIPTVESDRVPTSSEEDIFKALGMPFVDPKHR